MIRTFFFGCWNESCHYLHDEHGTSVSRDELRRTGLPSRLHCPDGVLCPGWRDGGYATPCDAQIEGAAALHHVDGWTALAWWDRSVDRRYGCNACFIAEGVHDAVVMLDLFRERFPKVAARMSYTIAVPSLPGERWADELRTIVETLPTDAILYIIPGAHAALSVDVRTAHELRLVKAALGLTDATERST